MKNKAEKNKPYKAQGKDVSLVPGGPFGYTENLLSSPDDFSTDIWKKNFSKVSFVQNGTIGSRGTSSVFETLDFSYGGSIYQQKSVGGERNLVFSVYLKSAGRNFVVIDTWDGNTNAAGVCVDLSECKFVCDCIVGSGFDVKSKNLTELGNGWSKVSVEIERGQETWLYHRISFYDCWPPKKHAGNPKSGIVISGAKLEFAES